MNRHKITSIGKYTYKLDYINVYTWNEGTEVKIGNYCCIAEDLKILLGGNHHYDWITTYPFGQMQEDIFGECSPHSPYSNGDVTIGNDVWIGAFVTIMSGITIGDGAVIAANSHVIKDVKPYELVGGNPAKHIKYRFSQEVIDLLLMFKWWELPEEEVKKLMPYLLHKPDIDALKHFIKVYRGIIV